MKKFNETMIVRKGKLVYAISLDDKANGKNSTYIYIDEGQVYFNQDNWFTSTKFDFKEETHRIAKEIFINQLQTDIKTRVLELKQLQEIFNELNLAECLQNIIPTSAKILEEVKSEMYLAIDNKVVDINKGLEQKVEEKIEENVKPIARKRKAKPSLIETQKQINKSIQKLNENAINMNQELNTKFAKINILENSLTTNVYTKEETIKAINDEIDYNNRLKEIKNKYPEMLEFIELISTNYANMDKYGILSITEMYSSMYEIKKK